MDALAYLTDDDLRALQRPLGDFVDESEPEENKYSVFEWDRYDWSQFDPREYGYNVIRLMGDPSNNRRKSEFSGAYFSVVDLFHYELLTAESTRWYPLVELRRDECGEYLEPREIKRIVAHRNDGKRPAGRGVLYMHRVVGEMNGDLIRDHINGYSLDNRSCNLRLVSHTVNNHNARRVRTANAALRPGVEWRDNAQCRLVGGVINTKEGKLRSEQHWPVEDQHLAQQWYLDKLNELYGHDRWAHAMAVPLPTLPPLKRPGDSVRISSSREDSAAAIPF